jgi:hypothetical protein
VLNQISNQSPTTSSRFIYSEKKSPENPLAVASEDFIHLQMDEVKEEEQIED